MVVWAGEGFKDTGVLDFKTIKLVNPASILFPRNVHKIWSPMSIPRWRLLTSLWNGSVLVKFVLWNKALVFYLVSFRNFSFLSFRKLDTIWFAKITLQI